MMQLALFVLALVAVFAVNAVIAIRTRDSIVADSVAFSWMSAKPEDAHAAAQAAEEQEQGRPVLAPAHVRRTAHAGI